MTRAKMSRLANEAQNVTLEQARKIGKGIRVLERKGDVFSFFRQITLPSCHVCKWPLFNSVISVLLPQDLGCINGINIAINVVLECAMKREMQSRSQKKPRAGCLEEYCSKSSKPLLLLHPHSPRFRYYV